MVVVGGDGGLLPEPVTQMELFLVPAERYDVVIDFSMYRGQNVTLHNSAPFEFGAPWSCPPFCPPTFNTGIDRFIRFVVDDEPVAPVEPPPTPNPNPNPNPNPSPPPKSCAARERARPQPPPPPPPPKRFFDSPTCAQRNALPARLRPPMHTGAVDRVRQIVLVETSTAILQSGHGGHGGPAVTPTPTEGEPHDHGDGGSGGARGGGVGGVHAELPIEVQGEHSIYLLTVNDQRFHDGLPFHEETTALPETCATERWEIINLTNDTHAIHLHIIEFELIGRANFSSFQFGHNPVLIEETIQPAHPQERGPKDVFHAHPGQSLFIQGFFDRPGRFVYHCHMLDHEDVEMMQNLEVMPGHCSCITSPLLRETEVVHARNLPHPWTLHRPADDSHEPATWGENEARGDGDAHAHGHGHGHGSGDVDHGDLLKFRPSLPNSYTVRYDTLIRDQLRIQAQRLQTPLSSNALHGAICPGSGGRSTPEENSQSMEPVSRSRIEKAIQEIRDMQ